MSSLSDYIFLFMFLFPSVVMYVYSLFMYLFYFYFFVANYTCSLAPLPRCSLVPLLPCPLLLPCSITPLLPCFLVPLLPCPFLLPCSLAPLLPCLLIIASIIYLNWCETQPHSRLIWRKLTRSTKSIIIYNKTTMKLVATFLFLFCHISPHCPIGQRQKRFNLFLSLQRVLPTFKQQEKK